MGAQDHPPQNTTLWYEKIAESTKLPSSPYAKSNMLIGIIFLLEFWVIISNMGCGVFLPTFIFLFFLPYRSKIIHLLQHFSLNSYFVECLFHLYGFRCYRHPSAIHCPRDILHSGIEFLCLFAKPYTQKIFTCKSVTHRVYENNFLAHLFVLTWTPSISFSIFSSFLFFLRGERKRCS